MLDRFGARLSTLRQSRGLTQTELGDAAGVSQRVIAYYETESTQPPGALVDAMLDTRRRATPPRAKKTQSELSANNKTPSDVAGRSVDML